MAFNAVEARQLVTGYQFEQALAYRQRQERLVRNPLFELEEDYKRIYVKNDYHVGFPDDIARVFGYFAKDNVYIVLGAQLGDEGKGRIVDNILQYIVDKVGLRKVYVTRFQGGSNAGHTVEKESIRLKLHQFPSVPFQPEEVEIVGIMDGQMNLNPVELRTEYDYIAKMMGQDVLKDRVIVSRNAILNTDLDRAEEELLDLLEERASGSTGEGMRISSAHYYDRSGLLYKDFMADDWREELGRKYDQLAVRFEFLGRNLAEVMVPDYDKVAEEEIAEHRNKIAIDRSQNRERPRRPVGSKEEFLDRLEEVRRWLMEHEMVKDTVEINLQSMAEVLEGKAAHIFEGAQAIGLHPWLGTIGDRDTTSTNTDPTGALYATKVFTVDEIKYKIGVMKATYMSSVGRRTMPTQVDLGKDVQRVANLQANATAEQRWAAWVREEADEFGTTTRRPRNICFVDLPFLTYNCLAGGINMLAATHLDIARKGEKIKVCTYYLKSNRVIPYYPGIDADRDVVPQYIELEGWDGQEVRRARSFSELPEAAKKYLAFVQTRSGIPLIFSTTGPNRNSYIRVPEQKIQRLDYIRAAEELLPQAGIIFPN